MKEAFIKEHELTFIKSTNHLGDFWAGEGTYRDGKFELFFTADKDGPTPVQLRRFEKLWQGIDGICESIRDRVRERLLANKPARWEKFCDAVVMIDIVGFNKDSEFVEIELLGALHRKDGIFVRNEGWNAKIRGNRVIELE